MNLDGEGRRVLRDGGLVTGILLVLAFALAASAARCEELPNEIIPPVYWQGLPTQEEFDNSLNGTDFIVCFDRRSYSLLLDLRAQDKIAREQLEAARVLAQERGALVDDLCAAMDERDARIAELEALLTKAHDDLAASDDALLSLKGMTASKRAGLDGEKRRRWLEWLVKGAAEGAAKSLIDEVTE
jgi:hypothetical protein